MFFTSSILPFLFDITRILYCLHILLIALKYVSPILILKSNLSSIKFVDTDMPKSFIISCIILNGVNCVYCLNSVILESTKSLARLLPYMISGLLLLVICILYVSI